MHHYIVDPNAGKFAYWRCNLDEREPRLLHTAVTGGQNVFVQKCHQQCYTFSSLLDHYRQHHHLRLAPVLDYCEGCHVLFYDKFHGLLHYLHHVTLLIDHNTSNEPDSTLKHSQDCTSCPPLFQEVQKMVNHLALAVNFGEEDEGEDDELFYSLLAPNDEEEPHEAHFDTPSAL